MSGSVQGHYFYAQLQYTVQYATTLASANNNDYCQANLWNGYNTSDMNWPIGLNCSVDDIHPDSFEP